MKLARSLRFPVQIRRRLAVVTALTISFLTVTIPASEPREGEPSVRINQAQLTLAGAERAVEASLKQAESMNVLVNIAVVDDGGHLLAFARMDGARPSSVYTSITKATSAATKRGETGPLHPGDPSSTQLNLAIENAAVASGGKSTSLKGGVPIIFDGQVIGAVGVGGATGEQDAEVAAAGAAVIGGNPRNAELPKNPAKALFADWLVESIKGRGVIDNVRTTIRFHDDGSITGSTGVNRFMAKADIVEDALSIQPGPATTRAAGPPARMDQESKFLATLPAIKSYHIDKNGRLNLLDKNGKEMLKASPLSNDQ